MSTRWWAPTRATLDPDAVVLALMEPDGESAGDLGANLLAAHRAGAAACDFVSKQAVPSPASLINALATSRVRMADHLVTSISKSMDTNYAALLVRDLFDDAEAGALSLYGTAVAKGVSPPMAASRVGAVYGVPSSSLGRYQLMACDPKSTVAALTDAADRCLLTYVASVVDQEVGLEPVTEVAKAGVAAFDPREHPRGAAGRFQNAPDHVAVAPNRPIKGPTTADPELLADLRRKLGGGGQSAPRVDTGPAQARRERPTRRSHPIRRGAERSVVATKAPKSRVKGKFKATVRSNIKMNPAMARHHQALRSVTPPPELVRRPGKEMVKPHDYAIPDLLRIPNHGMREQLSSSYEIHQALVFPVDGQTNNDFHTDMRDQAGAQKDPTQKIFRIGHLLQRAGNPEAEVAGRKESKRAADTMAEGELDNAGAENWDSANRAVRRGYIPPDTRKITSQEVLPGFKNPSMEELSQFYQDEREKEFVRRYKDPNGKVLKDVDEEEGDFVKIYPEYIPLGRHVFPEDYAEKYVVHYLPADDSRPSYRPMPMQAEYVIESDAVGYEEPSGDDLDKSAFVLDPNQAYKIVLPPSYHEAEVPGPEVMWDERRNLVIQRYYIRPIADEEVEEILGDDIGKAFAFREAQHPRAADGEWVRSRSGISEPNPRQVSRPEQEQRRERPVRRAHPVRRGADRQAKASERQTTAKVKSNIKARVRSSIKARVQMTPKQRHLTAMIRRAVTAASPSRPGLPPLNEHSRYLVFKHDPHGWGDGAGGEIEADYSDDYSDPDAGSNWEDSTSGQIAGDTMFSVIEETIDNDDLRLMWDNPGTSIHLGPITKELLLDETNMPVRSIASTLENNVEEQLWPPGGEKAEYPAGSISFTANERLRVNSEQAENDISDTNLSHKDIATKVASIFAGNHDIDQLQMVREGNQLTFYANTKPADAQHLVEMDPYLDIDAPMYLTYLGEYRAHELQYDLMGEQENVMDFSFSNDQVNVTSAKTHYFKVTRAPVHFSTITNAPRVTDR